jgi:hypothetical protein
MSWIAEAISKAIAATNAGLWAAEPRHHDLTAREEREATAFDNWVKGYGSRPTMNGFVGLRIFETGTIEKSIS